ncbi:hypothetical protein LPJ61_000199 [Coemansia biformis]|uniref:MoaB/Mog domain-containing protein n=1 Tax=Coemansia biformis TaxID=1286918 RepID=A0A9W8CYD0_9FUNG|nr:hypothetical protein LPJ61_000199 [Coemansia biformis]
MLAAAAQPGGIPASRWCRHVASGAARAALLARQLTTAPRAPGQPLTAALCVIGDEVLNGKTQDVNSHVFAKRCFALGVDVARIEVVPDQSRDICESVRRLSQRHQIVFTSGGIGPTHDDITYGAVASAFGARLGYHQPTLARMRRIMEARGAAALPDPSGIPDQVACARMALLPEDAVVAYPCSELWVPVVCVGGNVHVLPGIPALFSTLTDAYLPGLVASLTGAPPQAFARALVGTDLRESAIAPVLEELQRQFGPLGIRLGSYPDWPPPASGGARDCSAAGRPRVVLSAVGRDRAQVSACAAALCRLLAGRVLENSKLA